MHISSPFNYQLIKRQKRILLELLSSSTTFTFIMIARAQAQSHMQCNTSSHWPLKEIQRIAAAATLVYRQCAQNGGRL